MPESTFEVAALTQQLEMVLSNSAGAEQMAAAALSCGKPDATQQLVALVEHLAQKTT